jgi:hypothetical protein
MRFNPTEVQIEDHVVRATSACWIRTVANQVIDLSRYPKLAIVRDTDDTKPDLFAVVAFHKLGDLDNFDILFESEIEDEAKEYFENILEILKNPQTIH